MLKGSDQKFSTTIHWLSKKFKPDIQYFLSTDTKWSIFLLPPSCSPKHVVSKLYSSEPHVWWESFKDHHCGAKKSSRQKWARTLQLHTALSMEATVLIFNMEVEFPVMGFAGGSDSKEFACNAGNHVGSLGQEDFLKKEMATHPRIFARKIPWTKEPDGLQSTGSKRVGHFALCLKVTQHL